MEGRIVRNSVRARNSSPFIHSIFVNIINLKQQSIKQFFELSETLLADYSRGKVFAEQSWKAEISDGFALQLQQQPRQKNMPKTKAFHRYFMAALCKISSETNCKAKFPCIYYAPVSAFYGKYILVECVLSVGILCWFSWSFLSCSWPTSNRYWATVQRTLFVKNTMVLSYSRKIDFENYCIKWRNSSYPLPSSSLFAYSSLPFASFYSGFY